MKFSGKVGNGPLNKTLNFGGDPDHRLYTGIVFRIRHYREIRTGVNGHKSAAHTDSPDGKTCLGGGVHCPIASGSEFRSGRECWHKSTLQIGEHAAVTC